jgi:hypothetical protein
MSPQTDFVVTPVTPTNGKSGLVTFSPDVVRYRQWKKELILRNQTRDNTSLDVEAISPNADEPEPQSVGINTVQFLLSRMRSAPREITLQEWEGRVEQLDGRFIIARLVDITAGENEETEEVELPIDDVTEADQALLQPGAIFRWILGYSYASGRKERFARVVVRRLPIWTEREMQEADQEASELHDAIFGSSEDRSTSAGSNRS